MGIPSLEDVRQAVEAELGFVVRDVRRQSRWRPTWFVSAEGADGPFELVVRGDRVDTSVFPLDHEFRFHRLLSEHGIPVPKLYGWIDSIRAVAMEMIPGQPTFKDTPTEDRDQVVDDYLQALAQIHALPVQPFADAGIFRADRPENSSGVGRLRAIALFRSRKRRPMPFAEFCISWLLRHLPQSRGREAPILWDTGQFHHSHGHLNAILDLEFGHIGDPMMDLAVWRMRDTLIPFGDFRQIYARYEELSGRPIDLETIRRHHFAGTTGNLLMFGPAILDPVSDTDLMTNMQWTSETNLHATEALAEAMGAELPEAETPEPRQTREDATFDHLIRQIGLVSSSDPEVKHQLRLMFRTARHLRRVNEIGDAVVSADLDDLYRVTGIKAQSWQDGDTELEQFVAADAGIGRHDEALLWLFHRRNLRSHMQMGPPGSSMTRHFPTQRFDEFD